MEHALAPIYDSLPLQLLFGLLVAANFALPVRIRYEGLLLASEIDRAGLAIYQRSGFWLATFQGFVAAFLPPFLVPTASVVGFLGIASWFLVGRTVGRLYRVA
jgi:hypothetical protein